MLENSEVFLQLRYTEDALESGSEYVDGYERKLSQASDRMSRRENQRSRKGSMIETQQMGENGKQMSEEEQEKLRRRALKEEAHAVAPLAFEPSQRCAVWCRAGLASRARQCGVWTSRLPPEHDTHGWQAAAASKGTWNEEKKVIAEELEPVRCYSSSGGSPDV